MQKTILAAVVLLFSALVLPKVTFASVDVNVSGNAAGSSSSVSVNNVVNSNSSSNNSSSTYTNVVVESNGERKEYHGSDSNVNIQSSNGNNTVSIHNTASAKPTAIQKSSATIVNNVSATAISGDSSSSASPSAWVYSATPEAQGQQVIEERKKTLLQIIEDKIKELFSFFK